MINRRANSLVRNGPGIANKSGAAVQTPAGWRVGAAAVKGSNWIFFGYLLLIALEFTGLPNEIPLLKVARVTTLLSYTIFALIVFKASDFGVFAEREMRILFLFLGWTILSLTWAYVTMHAFNAIRPLFDYIMLGLITAYVLDRRSRVEALAMVLTFVAAVLVFRNHANLGSAQRVGGLTAPYFLGDGNDFAWGMNVLFPLICCLVIGRRRLIIRLVGIGGVAICLIGTIGTSSRGGTIGLAAALLYSLVFVARRKFVAVLALIVIGTSIALFAPGSYFSRMGTIAAYEEDNSAQARLQAWGAATRMALHYPLGVGAGNFNSIYGRWYNPSTQGGAQDRVGWGARRWISTHSMYFKVLAEYGFGGLALLITLIGTNIRDNNRSRRLLQAQSTNAPFDDRWPALINMSVVACAVSGIFLGGFSYPYLFILSGLTVGLKRILALEKPIEGFVTLVQPAGHTWSPVLSPAPVRWLTPTMTSKIEQRPLAPKRP